ncbi:MAG: ABC transporter permease subunit [Firmicutes bacterium]|nr:ABC transporter permease subunit [Bacillota bacterium]
MSESNLARVGTSRALVRWPRAVGPIILGIAVCAVGAPLWSILSYAGHPTAVVGGYAPPASEAIWTPTLDSALLAVSVAVLSLCIAFGPAWAMSATRLRKYPIFHALVLVPLMTPPYLTTIGWLLTMEPGGYLTQWLPWTQGLANAFVSFGGLTFLMSLHEFPIAYLALVLALRAVPRAGVDAARVHGLRLAARVRHIWWPTLAPVVATAGLLVFVNSVGEFGTPLVFGSLLRFPVLTTQIYQAMNSYPVQFPLAARLALLTLAMCLLVAGILWLLRRRLETPALLRSLDADVDSLSAPAVGARTWVGACVLLIVCGLALGVPIASMVATSAMKAFGDGFSSANLTFQHYAHLFSASSSALVALLHTLEIATMSATIAAAVAIGLACLLRFWSSLWTRLTTLVVLLPNTIPHILFVVGLIIFWDAPWLPFTLYDSSWLLVLAFVILLLPYVLIQVVRTLSALPKSLWESGRAHGLPRLSVAWRLVTPLLVPSLLSGWIAVFALSMRDITVPLMASPPGYSTAPGYIYEQYVQTSLPQAMAMACLTVAVGMIAFLLMQGLTARVGRSRKPRTDTP